MEHGEKSNLNSQVTWRVTMMQPLNFGDCDDLCACLKRLDLSRFGRVLAKTQMAAAFIVVRPIGFKSSLEMMLVERNNMVCALSYGLQNAMEQMIDSMDDFMGILRPGKSAYGDYVLQNAAEWFNRMGNSRTTLLQS